MKNFLRRLFAGERLSEPALRPPGFIQPRIAALDPMEICEAPARPPPKRTWSGSDLADRAFVLVYCAANGAESERRVICRVVYEANGVGYMQAHCLERDAPRCFRIDRIRELYCGIGGDLLGPPASVLVPFGINAIRPSRNHQLSNIERRVRRGVRVLMTLARSDGRLHPAEMAVVERYVEAAMPARTEPATKAAIVEYARRLAPSFESFADCARAALKPDKRGTLLIEAARELIGADGEVSPDEGALISDLEHLLAMQASRGA